MDSVWKWLTLLAVVLASAALGLGAYVLRGALTDAAENRQTICSIGSFLTGAPIVRPASTSQAQFIGQLVTTRKFLRDLLDLGCEDLDEFGRKVSREEIEAQLDAIADELRRQRDRRQAAPGPVRSGAEKTTESGGDDDGDITIADTDPVAEPGAPDVPDGGGGPAGGGGDPGGEDPDPDLPGATPPGGGGGGTEGSPTLGQSVAEIGGQAGGAVGEVSGIAGETIDETIEGANGATGGAVCNLPVRLCGSP